MSGSTAPSARSTSCSCPASPIDSDVRAEFLSKLPGVERQQLRRRQLDGRSVAQYGRISLQPDGPNDRDQSRLRLDYAFAEATSSRGFTATSRRLTIGPTSTSSARIGRWSYTELRSETVRAGVAVDSAAVSTTSCAAAPTSRPWHFETDWDFSGGVLYNTVLGIEIRSEAFDRPAQRGIPVAGPVHRTPISSTTPPRS